MTRPQETPSKPVRVLVVDDEPAVRAVIVRGLATIGFTAVEAGNGRDAATVMQTDQFDLIITDIVMPERDGIEFLMGLPKNAHRPGIIAISGSSVDSPLYLKVANRLGADRVLRKPFSLSELIEATRDVLARRRPAEP